MRTAISVLAIMGIGACGGEVRTPITFSCVSSDQETGDPGREVLFHFAEGYLFLQNDQGGAENVCNRRGTTECSVQVTADSLTLRQAVEEPYCGYRTVARTNLDIDRNSGAFRLIQERCDPSEDFVITGQCRSISD